MSQNKTLFSAICEHGRTNVEIAKSMGVSPQSVSKWLSGTNLLPVRRRAAFERAVSVQNIDWWGYEQELKAQRGGGNTRPHQELKPPAPPEPKKSGGFWGSIWDDEEELNGA